VSKVQEFYAFKPSAHDFYRCYDCNRIFTYEYEQNRLREMTEGDSHMCRCGGRKYSATRPVGPEWLLVLPYTAKLVLARGLAPWLGTRHPRTLRLVEWLAGNKLTR
jgi:hypothetical protein